MNISERLDCHAGFKGWSTGDKSGPHRGELIVKAVIAAIAVTRPPINICMAGYGPTFIRDGDYFWSNGMLAEVEPLRNFLFFNRLLILGVHSLISGRFSLFHPQQN